jgi:hypothetical protein
MATLDCSLSLLDMWPQLMEQLPVSQILTQIQLGNQATNQHKPLLARVKERNNGRR